MSLLGCVSLIRESEVTLDLMPKGAAESEGNEQSCDHMSAVAAKPGLGAPVLEWRAKPSLAYEVRNLVGGSRCCT